MNIADFASQVLGKPLYPYQLEAAEAILASVRGGHGRIISVMMARQSGKNQLSAVLEAYLLATHDAGAIIKAAPTFNPQIRNSHERLMRLLRESSLGERVWSNAAMIGLAPEDGTEREKKQQGGPRVLFYSASPESNVVGATAELLLEIDEAQDVNPDKFDKDFRPMASTANATTVMYGTAWGDDTLLARQRAHNLDIERTTGEKYHFEYNWRSCAAANPNYELFVKAEIERLGEQHIAVQTQYYLHSISGAGYFFSDLQRTLLAGSHVWETEPDSQPGVCYVAGLDVGGEERADPSDPEKVNVKRDSTVLTIGRVQYNELQLPTVEVVHQVWWTGKTYPEQYAAVLALCGQWDIRHLCIDNTGQGAGLASMLIEKLGKERVEAYVFSRMSKSRLGYQLLALVNGGRFTLYHQLAAPGEIYVECWQQIKKARYTLPAPETINFYVDQAEGHDDFLISLALCAQALEAIVQPAAGTRIVPKAIYPGESRF